MKKIESIYIRIAELKACVNDIDSDFDEVMESVLNDAFEIKELLSDSSVSPHIQLDKSVWCDDINHNIDAVFLNIDGAIYALCSSKDTADIDTYMLYQIPRKTMLEVMLQIRKQVKRVEENTWGLIYHTFFKQCFQFWHKSEGHDLLYSLQMAVMETKRLKRNPFKPQGEEVNQEVLQRFCRYWECTINDIINQANEGVSYDDIRVCDNCGLPMSEGYYLGGEYACDKDCCLALYKGDKAQMEEDLRHSCEDNGDCYYTGWDSVFFD